MGRKRSVPLLLFFAMGFLVTGCGELQERTSTLASPAPPILPIQTGREAAATVSAQSPLPTVSISPSIREGLPASREVLEAMYGREALSIDGTEALLPAPVPNRIMTVHINLMACFWEGPDKKCLVVTDRAFDNCHVCQADIDSAIFQLINGSWELVVFQSKAISLGSFGHVPKGELIQIGPDKYAALIESDWGARL